MELIYSRPKTLAPRVSAYCPGCLHALATKIIAEVIEEMDIADNTIMVPPVGCGGNTKRMIDVDVVSATHGRAHAVASGISRCVPDKLVFTYQGDGDCAAIGLSETLCAANRGDNFVGIFINNSTYGMTGGQMAPTTLVGQTSTTTPCGRNAASEGYPMHMCELVNQLKAPRYIARFALNDPANVRKAKEGIRHAFELQQKHIGFCFIELLTNCPTNWGMTPVKSLEHMKEYTMKEFVPGVFRDEERSVADDK